jgi:2-dehydro-3-deoxyphosphogluconate aldolase/(4S)-4-hydroxy-2-oxoglutarate aldolase
MQGRRETLEKIVERRLIGVLRLDSPERAIEMAGAMADGGITTIEVTLTTPGAIGVIAELGRRRDLIVGAGSVLTEAQAREAFSAGARFYASPIFDPLIMAIARAADAMTMPGALTPTEIVNAWSGGADLVKIFPMPADGASYIKSIRGPLPEIRLAPSGGVSPATIPSLLGAGASALNVGTWLTHEPDGELGSAAAITARATECRLTLMRHS